MARIIVGTTAPKYRMLFAMKRGNLIKTLKVFLFLQQL
ncbi:hypothetical protein AB205_0111400 [Aquarana catesbeiana]|uniref:Uncharacterized protein n=1 Tax=Aquarana catesbeiana TaxID=8400 RepID=A0A2G9QG69_AQUCT|nr:hypothetical protein AB205_0111400 [Aquarana catesbeiana]